MASVAVITSIKNIISIEEIVRQSRTSDRRQEKIQDWMLLLIPFTLVNWKSSGTSCGRTCSDGRSLYARPNALIRGYRKSSTRHRSLGKTGSLRTGLPALLMNRIG